MNNTNQQIREMYETLGMSVSEIASSEGYEEAAIKAILIQTSPLFRESLKKESSKHTHDQITDEEERVLFDAYKFVALNSEVDAVRERALRNLINEKRGRNDVRKVVQGNTINVVMINDSIRKAKEAIKRIKDQSAPNPSSPKQLIDIAA